MERVTRKLFDYLHEMKRTITRKRLHNELKKEVETGKNGPQIYVVKQGVNKGRTL